MKKNILNIVLIAFIGILLAGCTKEIVGPQGPAGQDGIDGVDGVDGNANVKSEISIISWSTLTAQSISATFTTDLITQNIIDKGSINVSLSTNQSSWVALPYGWAGRTNVFLWYWCR